MPTDPEKLKAEIDARHLEMVGAFVPVNFRDINAHQSGEMAAVKTAELLSKTNSGNPFIILSDNNGSNEFRTKNAGRISNGHGLSEKEWKIFPEGVEKIARAVKEKTGLRTVFHHHCAGFVETPAEIEMLMNHTDENLVGLCLDMGHYKFGGGDPVEAIKKYKRRIWHVHFKDCHKESAEKSRAMSWDYFTSVKNGVFCELGKGEVDFHRVLGELKNIDYSGWIVVEQDVLPGMGAPMECAVRNREFIKSLGV